MPELARILDSEPGIDFVQCGYSLATRDAEDRLFPTAAARRVAVIVNQPFETGGMFRQVRGRAVPEWAAEFDCASWAQLFLKYILAEPAVTCVIPATGKPEHMQDNLKAGFGRLPDAGQRRRIREFGIRFKPHRNAGEGQYRTALLPWLRGGSRSAPDDDVVAPSGDGGAVADAGEDVFDHVGAAVDRGRSTCRNARVLPAVPEEIPLA